MIAHKPTDPGVELHGPEKLPGALDQEASAQAPESSQLERYAPLLLCLIILLGFAIRLSALKWGQAYSYFGQGDAVEAYQVAVNYGHGEPRAQYLGQPNYNFHSKLPGPLWTIFCFLSLRFWGSAEGIVLTIILLNTAVIYFVYLLTRQTMGTLTALFAALFTATFPWVVYYSAGLYNPDVMSFLGSLLFVALWTVIRTERSLTIFWVPILLLMLPQFHMSGLLMIPAVMLILWLSQTRLNLPWLSLGIAAALCLYIPYFRGEIAHDWQNTRAMFTADAPSKGYNFESLKAISAPLSFLVNWGPRWTRSMAEYRELGRACFGSFAVFLAANVISMIFAGFVIVGMLLQIRQRMTGFWREPRAVFAREPAISFLTLLLIVPLLIATIDGKPFHTRYCVLLLPPLLSLAAIGAAHWLDKKGSIGRLFPTLLVLTCAANVWISVAMYRHQGNRIEQSTVFVPSFRQLETVLQKLKAYAGTNSTVQVDDTSYLRTLSPTEKQLRDAALIRQYVNAREKDTETRTQEGSIKIFELQRAEAVPEDSPAMAYRGHGIALIARGSK